jgi:hypothetical protein
MPVGAGTARSARGALIPRGTARPRTRGLSPEARAKTRRRAPSPAGSSRETTSPGSRRRPPSQWKGPAYIGVCLVGRPGEESLACASGSYECCNGGGAGAFQRRCGSDQCANRALIAQTHLVRRAAVLVGVEPSPDPCAEAGGVFERCEDERAPSDGRTCRPRSFVGWAGAPAPAAARPTAAHSPRWSFRRHVREGHDGVGPTRGRRPTIRHGDERAIGARWAWRRLAPALRPTLQNARRDRRRPRSTGFPLPTAAGKWARGGVRPTGPFPGGPAGNRKP